MRDDYFGMLFNSKAGKETFLSSSALNSSGVEDYSDIAPNHRDVRVRRCCDIHGQILMIQPFLRNRLTSL